MQNKRRNTSHQSACKEMDIRIPTKQAQHQSDSRFVQGQVPSLRAILTSISSKLAGTFMMTILALSVVLTAQVHAADADVANGSVEQESAEVVDPFGRNTPRTTIQGFINALSENNATLASNYLNLDVSDNAVEVVRQVKLALDTGGRLETDLQISNLPSGNLADKLQPNLEKVGTITVGEQVIDLMLERKTHTEGQQYWQISAETIAKIKNTDLTAQQLIIDQYTFEPLQNKTIAGYNLADIFAVFLLALFCIISSYLLVGLCYLIIKNFYPKVRKKNLPIDAKFILPLALVITSIIMTEVMVYAGVSVTVREPVNRIKDIVGWFALTWLLLRVIDAVFNRAERESYKHNQTERVSILSLVRKVVKALLLILAAIYIFGNLGFDLTTGIAALGVGGLALALGAQKMIENLVGSVVVVADQPVRVGDYCKFGNLEGTVVDIGIRSTRVRTLDRTIVTIPNGDFSAMSIENFASRDMYHFYHNLYIKRNVTAKTMEEFVAGLNDFISNHEFSNSEWSQVRIIQMRQDCLVLDVRTYMYAQNPTEFFNKQSQLIIELLKEVEKYPVEHALPTQQMIIESSDKASQPQLVEHLDNPNSQK